MILYSLPTFIHLSHFSSFFPFLVSLHIHFSSPLHASFLNHPHSSILLSSSSCTPTFTLLLYVISLPYLLFFILDTLSTLLPCFANLHSFYFHPCLSFLFSDASRLHCTQSLCLPSPSIHICSSPLMLHLAYLTFLLCFSSFSLLQMALHFTMYCHHTCYLPLFMSVFHPKSYILLISHFLHCFPSFSPPLTALNFTIYFLHAFLLPPFMSIFHPKCPISFISLFTLLFLLFSSLPTQFLAYITLHLVSLPPPSPHLFG